MKLSRPSSDFYDLRRSAIRDMTAGVSFLIGFLLGAAGAWDSLREATDRQDVGAGLVRLFGEALVVGLVGGAIGLIVGMGIGAAWEPMHRRRRATRPTRDDDAPARADAPVAPGRERQTPHAAWSVRYDAQPLALEDFLALSRAALAREGDATAWTAALAATRNIGAWQEGRLVGVARVLGDGHTFATIVEVFVHPEFRRMGIGRELMRRAAAVAPGGVLSVGAHPDGVRFYECVGATRGADGFVLRAPPGPADRPVSSPRP